MRRKIPRRRPRFLKRAPQFVGATRISFDMTLDDARREAKDQADKAGSPIAIFDDPILHGEDAGGTFGFMPTLAIPIFIGTLKFGTLIEVVEPATSGPDRRADLENGLIELFRKDPNLITAIVD